MQVLPDPSCVRLTRRARRSQLAGVLAVLAITSFILFDALDLDGLAEAFSAPSSAVLATTLADPEADRAGVPPHDAVIGTAVDVRIASMRPISQTRHGRTRLQIVRPARRHIAHTRPTAPDPL